MYKVLVFKYNIFSDITNLKKAIVNHHSEPSSVRYIDSILWDLSANKI